VPIVVSVRWSDLVVEELPGVATHGAWSSADDAVVHCRLQGSRFGTQIETWFPAADVERT
jgi:hypothetical protein